MNLDTRTHIISHPLTGTLGEAMSQCEMVNTSHFELTVPNPDNQWDLPIYSGDPAKAHEVLEPGTYKGIIENWALDTSSHVEVHVFQHFTILGYFPLDGRS